MPWELSRWTGSLSVLDQKLMLGEIMSHLKACQHRELAHAVTESIVILNYNCVCTNACARNIKMYNDVPICSRRLKSLAQSGHTEPCDMSIVGWLHA